jgi:antitoxin (DNA-binding transcriptional repressor) of toxin-antitoxin stability system
MTDKITKTVDIAEARGNLSKLIDQAGKGEPFINSKGGKPLVEVSALGAPGPTKTRWLGFMEGQIVIPDDFDTMYSSEIEQMFNGDE